MRPAAPSSDATGRLAYDSVTQRTIPVYRPALPSWLSKEMEKERLMSSKQQDTRPYSASPRLVKLVHAQYACPTSSLSRCTCASPRLVASQPSPRTAYSDMAAAPDVAQGDESGVPALRTGRT